MDLSGYFRKVGRVAYKLQLPDNAQIHPVFHVSQLKKHLGAQAVPQVNLPLVTTEGYIKIEPISVLQTRVYLEVRN
uniref:Tf2-1-like SH3-like domain-containing protein n=1 Tax=Arundo donax TaxID=35708 RepID=A0A0A8XUE5_ARUDO